MLFRSIVSLEELNSSANNSFYGFIKEIFPVKLGIEVVIDIGIEISAHISYHSMEKLQLEIDKKVWINFKASAVIFTRN